MLLSSSGNITPRRLVQYKEQNACLLSPDTSLSVVCTRILEGYIGTMLKFEGGVVRGFFFSFGFVVSSSSPAPLLTPAPTKRKKKKEFMRNSQLPQFYRRGSHGSPRFSTPAGDPRPPAGCAPGVRRAAAGCQCSPGVRSPLQPLLRCSFSLLAFPRSSCLFLLPSTLPSPPRPLPLPRPVPFPLKCQESHYCWARLSASRAASVVGCCGLPWQCPCGYRG